MDTVNKELALKLLIEKQQNQFITYERITRETGYSERQLIRLSKELKQKDIESILTHGNTGRKPITTASDQEVSYLRKFKEPYPEITIAQFRDIFIEDVINNPQRKSEVQQYGLKPRSPSWFRQLFINEGWQSPLRKPSRTANGRTTHPVRPPRPSRGELTQIDGTPFDWFGDGRVYTLHLAVDDATTEVLAGWFMSTECTRGYARMLKLIIEKEGKPLALYSDKDSVFRSVKNGAPSQFGRICSLLHIEQIFANSPEGKGRIERYNGTAQNRLPNDIIRFGIPHDYNVLNEWFNSFYIKYLNSKFSFSPADPRDSYIEVPDDFNYSRIFRAEYPRVIFKTMFSMNNRLYSPFDENGELLVLNDRKHITVCIDIVSEEMYIEYYGKRYTCYQVGERKRNKVHETEGQKQLQELLDKRRTDSSY